LRRLGLKTQGGYIIAVEGIDAVGKKTHSRLLFESLRKRKLDAAQMAFPDYDTAIGKEITSFLSGKKDYPPELQHLLFAANRWEKFTELRSRLKAGEIVIINRYTASNLAYGSANGLDVDWLANLERGLPPADLTIVLDAPPQSLLSRRPGRGKDAYEKSSAIQAKAQKAYRELALKRGWKLVDAQGSVEEVQALVLRSVREALQRDRGTSA
jgi:dTMP kinase